MTENNGQNNFSTFHIFSRLNQWHHLQTNPGIFWCQTGLPQLFNLFINALIENIKKLGLGLKCGELILALLKFADDIALMAETEKDLQWMLKELHFWCECRLLCINISKTKIVHFRQKSQLRTSFEFKYGPSKMQIVLQWIWHDKHLDYQSCATALAESANQEESLHGVWGSIIAALTYCTCNPVQSEQSWWRQTCHLLWL